MLFSKWRCGLGEDIPEQFMVYGLLMGHLFVLPKRPTSVHTRGISPNMNKPRVVIVGGGFGGLTAAMALKKAPVHITLIDRNNHHLFQPLLYQVATAGLSPANIASPIRGILSEQENVDVLMGEVHGIDTGKKQVLLDDRQIAYDDLILATGARHSYLGHESWEENAPGLKSIEDATLIRRKILLAFEHAESEPNLETKQAYLTFVVVGAGPTGVELCGAIAELSHVTIAQDFRHIDPKLTKIILIESGPRILAAFTPEIAEAATKKLKSMGVEILVGGRVENIDASGVRIGEKQIVSKNVIWAAGVSPSPAGKWLNAETDKSGRVKVNPDLTVPGQPQIFVIGDTATLSPPENHGKPLPGVAPVAMQQGRYVAKALVDRLKGKKAAPFKYIDKGNLATVGRAFAIAEFKGLKISGFFAWVLWLLVHIYYLIGFRNRAVVLLEWAWGYLTFQRGARLIVGDPAQDHCEETSGEESKSGTG
jgi:NADH dehydrogenase